MCWQFEVGGLKDGLSPRIALRSDGLQTDAKRVSLPRRWWWWWWYREWGGGGWGVLREPQNQSACVFEVG